MDSDRWERVKELFEAALERDAPERSPFLVQACGNDEGLRREIESLLAGHEQAGGFMQTQAARRHAAALLTETGPACTFSPSEIVSGRFQVLRFLGRGGMGEVYEARDLEREVRVALKTILPEIAADPRTLARFKQEIEMALRVAHRNVCRVHDLERHRPPRGSGKPEIVFLTMEMLDGETLAERLRRQGRLTGAEGLSLIRQMAEGLAAAHTVGVVHRDFKPGNVMLVSEGPATRDSRQSTQSGGAGEIDREDTTANRPVRAVITDFGLARAMRPTITRESVEKTLSTGGQLIGTLAYMAPEQWEGRPATPSSDVYALGLVAYEIVTGQPPFPDPTPFADAFGRLNAKPPAPRSLPPDLDPTLESIILRCLETNPTARYRNAEELVAALDRSPSASRLLFSRRTIMAVSLVVLVLLLALLGGGLRLIHRERKAIPEVTTSSPEALQHYLQAYELFTAQDLPGSIEMARSATELDPSFAMAHLLLAKDYDEGGDEKNSREQLDLALRSVRRVSEREKLLILAYNDYYGNVFQKALEEYRLVLQLHPGDLEGLDGVANTAFWVGQPAEAIEARRERLRLGRYDAKDYIELMDLLIRKSAFDEVLNIYSDAVLRSLRNPQIHWPASIAFWGKDNLASAHLELDHLREGGGTREADLAGLYSARILQYEGRMREADDALRAGLALDQQQQSNTWVPVRLYLLVKGDLIAGRSEKARLDAQQLALATTADSPDTLQRAGLISIYLGRLADARHYLSALDRLRSERNSVFTQSYYLNLKGEFDLAEGAIEGAAASERQALMLFATNQPYISLGKIYAKNHDWQGAIDAYEKFLSFKGEVLRDECSAEWVVAHLELARAYRELGDHARAKIYYDRFLKLWNNADPALPLLRQAQRERKALDLGN